MRLLVAFFRLYRCNKQTFASVDRTQTIVYWLLNSKIMALNQLCLNIRGNSSLKISKKTMNQHISRERMTNDLPSIITWGHNWIWWPAVSIWFLRLKSSWKFGKNCVRGRFCLGKVRNCTALRDDDDDEVDGRCLFSSFLTFPFIIGTITFFWLLLLSLT